VLALLSAQRADGVDARGAAGGQIAGEQRDAGEDDRGDRDADDVARRHVEQETLQRAADEPRGDEADDRAGRGPRPTAPLTPSP
jgi:hypothetical protein